ncbi:addiction module toxin, RelE/StbE family [Bacteroidia bacterium]|nr:addiction module toxin, RelE/StbE family [Bacteroidia bacterium]
MYNVRRSSQFKKDIKLCSKRNWNLPMIAVAMNILQEKGTLPDTYLPHPLHGKYKALNIWECHIEPDWLLLWYITETDDPAFEGEIIFVRTGTHSDIF